MFNVLRIKALFVPFKSYCQQKFPQTMPELKNLPKVGADTFGNFGDAATTFDLTKSDPEDIQEEIRKKKMDKRSPGVYIDMVKTHLQNHQYQKAVEILEERMLKIDRVKPDSYIYDLLISYCGRKGDVKEAFRLYNQMKNRGYHVTGGQYTSLFNACANSRNSQLAIEVAGKVKQFLSADNVHKVNVVNYNSMLKAFGRHGDLKTSLKIVDEVLEKRGKVRDDTYNFLLQACISDFNSGFRHALYTWHRMLQHKTDPSVFTFNLILRATRDCHLGDPTQIQDLLDSILRESSSRFLRKLNVSPVSSILPSTSIEHSTSHHSLTAGEKSISADTPVSGEIQENKILEGSKDQLLDNRAKELAFVSLKQELSIDLPNMLAIKPKSGSFTSLASFKSAYHRLLLMGGAVGFLQVMDSIGVKPNIKTFTLLLQIVPSTKEAEEDLIRIMKSKRISFDTGFFNVLMKKRCFRLDYTAAKEVLRMMQVAGVPLDLITFGVLALTCTTKEDAEEFIANVHDAGFRLNSEMLAPLVRRATHIGDLQMGLLLLRTIKEDNVQPNPKLMSLLHKFVETHRVKTSQ